MSPRANVAEGFESVIVTVEVCPMPTLVGLAERRALGAIVSIVIGVIRAPARFWLPATSVKEAVATEIRPEPVKFESGVKIAV